MHPLYIYEETENPNIHKKRGFCKRKRTKCLYTIIPISPLLFFFLFSLSFPPLFCDMFLIVSF